MSIYLVDKPYSLFIMSLFDTRYSSSTVEKKWSELWKVQDTYRWLNNEPKDKTFSIDTPPPTVSGLLHMGHIYSYTQTDIIARYKRMIGKNVFFPIGFDDNGLPTERYVEKQIGKRGIEMSRAEFIEKCSNEIKKAEKEFEELFTMMGFSFDWSRKYQTISKKSRAVSQMSFLHLYQSGRLYKAAEPCIYDIVDRTSLAQTEVEDREIEGAKHYLYFYIVEGTCNNDKVKEIASRIRHGEIPICTKDKDALKPDLQLNNQKFINLSQTKDDIQFSNGKTTQKPESSTEQNNKQEDKALGETALDNRSNIKSIDYVEFLGSKTSSSIRRICIMTTRPELLPACVALFVHPNDFDSYVGCSAITPFGVAVALLADKSVDREKGTGFVMCCTFGDQADVIWWRTHNLPLRVIIDRSGKIDLSGACIDNIGKIDSSNSDSDNVVNFSENSDNMLQFPKTATDTTQMIGDGVITPVIFKDDSNTTQVAVSDADRSQVSEDRNISQTIENGSNIIRLFGDKDEATWIIGSDIYDTLNGLTLFNTRRSVMELLLARGCIAAQTEKIIHAVKVGERSKKPIEILVADQWFIKVLDIKEELKAKGRECEWHPEWMGSRLDSWIDGLSWDWCISRQRFSGVPIPVWYSKRLGEEGKVLVANLEQLPVDPLVDLPVGYSREEVEPENDILDTWATSSVSPQLSSLCINKKDGFYLDDKEEDLALPFDLRPQAHEIIRTWAFCTIVKTYCHTNTIPWKSLMISGWCLAADKSKMSKSKGNVVTPMSLIESKGVDAVRYWAAKSKLGADVVYSDDVIAVGAKLVTKLYNAARFVSGHMNSIVGSPNGGKMDNGSALGVGDECCRLIADLESGIIHRTLDRLMLYQVIINIDSADCNFHAFNYSSALVNLESLFKGVFCDIYLELVKIRCYGASAKKFDSVDLSDKERSDLDAGRTSAVLSAGYCLDLFLRLLAPFMPFVTEELYSNLFPSDHKAFGGSIHARGTWPNVVNIIYKTRKSNGEAIAKVIKATAIEDSNFNGLKVTNDKLDLVKLFGKNCNFILNNEISMFLLRYVEMVRKWKSEHQLSMNSPVKSVTLPKMVIRPDFPEDMFEDVKNAIVSDNVIEDLKNAFCSDEIKFEGDSMIIEP